MRTTRSARPTGTRRAAPLAPDDRRAALVAATVPLLREHGLAVTTKAIAEAAGVAEGTIFGVFPDKASLLREAALAAVAPDPVVERLESIDHALPLDARLVAAIDVLHDHLAGVTQLYATPGVATLLGNVHTGPGAITAAVAAVLEPDRKRLRHPPGDVAHLLVSVVVGGHPSILGPSPLSTAQVVRLVLHGACR